MIDTVKAQRQEDLLWLLDDLEERMVIWTEPMEGITGEKQFMTCMVYRATTAIDAIRMARRALWNSERKSLAVVAQMTDMELLMEFMVIHWAHAWRPFEGANLRYTNPDP